MSFTIVRIGNNPWMQVVHPIMLLATLKKCLNEIGSVELQVETEEDHWIATIDNDYDIKRLIAHLS